MNSGALLQERANYFEITEGTNWNPTTNLRVRPEIRYDWANGMGANNDRYDPQQGTYRQPDLWTFGCDVILFY